MNKDNNNSHACNSLIMRMAVTPRYRLNGLPSDTANVVVFCHKDNAAQACADIYAHCPRIHIAGICVHKSSDESLKFNKDGMEHEIPIINPQYLKNMPQCTAVLYWRDSIVPDLLYHLETAVRITTDIAIFPHIPHGVGRKMDASLYMEHGGKLEKIYSELADDESRASFASVVKGLLKGEIEWLRPPICPEYQHPCVCASPGDIVLDAGLFDSTVLRKFALQIGSTGHVYGFEPEPANYEFVKNSLRIYGDPGNITLLRKGLYSRCGEMGISADGPSGSLISADEKSASLCKVVDVDSFAEEYSLPRIDLIKMDIEGAEMDALTGAEKSIRKWKPKLQICAYHHINDIIDIYDCIKGIEPEYKFYFTAHAPYLNEYVYYAAVQ